MSLNNRNLFHNDLGTWVVYGFLFATVIFNIWHLFAEIEGTSILQGDRGYHLLLAEAAADAMIRRDDVTDPWLGTISMGFPVFHYYQHLPHIVVAGIHLIMFNVIPLADVIRWTIYLLLVFFPLSTYWALRRFNFSPLTAVMAAVVSPLIGPDFALFGGLSYNSYTFAGWGLYAQLWGMVFFLPGLAIGHRAIATGRGYFWATLLLTMTLMSHLVFGYMTFITLGVLTITKLRIRSNHKALLLSLWVEWRRLVLLLLFVVIVSSYFLVPFFWDREYFNTITLNKQVVMDSFGYQSVIKALVTGALFDLGRFPSFTLLLTLGVGVCVFKWRREPYRIPLVVFLFWLILFFGRPTWGSFIDIVSLNQSVGIHRFVAGVHFGGILLAGVGLAFPWSWALRSGKIWRVLTCLVLTLLVLLPLYMERGNYFLQNTIAIQENRNGLDSESTELKNLFDTLKTLPQGRVFVAHQEIERGVNRYLVQDIPMGVLLHAEGFDVFSNGIQPHYYSLPSVILKLFDQNNQLQYGLFNARYIVAPPQWELPDFAILVGQFGRHHLYQVETTGYFELVGTGTAFELEQADFFGTAGIWLNSNFLELQRHPELLINRSSPISMGESSAGLVKTKGSDYVDTVESTHKTNINLPRGLILSEEIGNSFYAAKVIVERNSILLLKASYHPNWRATVETGELQTVMVMPGFMGIPLTPGEHHVMVQYESRLLRKALMFLGLVTLLLIMLWDQRSLIGSGGSLSKALAYRSSYLLTLTKFKIRNKERDK